jgi:hypothetical protein
MGERQMHEGFWWRNLRETDHLKKPRRKWEDNIEIDLQGIGGGVDWIHLAQDTDKWWSVVNTVIIRRVP